MHCAHSNSAILSCLVVFDFSLFVAAQCIFIHIFYNLQSFLQSVVVLCYRENFSLQVYVWIGCGAISYPVHWLSIHARNATMVDH